MTGWKPNRPLGTDILSISDDLIRDNWNALGTILGGTTAAGGITFGACHHFIPISTSDRDTHISIVNGKTVYNSTVGKPQVIVNSKWLNYITAQDGEVQGNIFIRNNTSWVTLAPGSNGFFLMAQGGSANPVWSGFTHALGGFKHSSSSLADLNNKISDATLDDIGSPRDPNAHKSTHQDGGSDKIGVTGLLGLLADPQTPAAHTFDSHSDVAAITEAQGQVIYYDGSNWNALDPGTTGQFLKTQGSDANPLWASVAAAGVDRMILSPAGAIRGARGITDAPEARMTDGTHSWIGLKYDKDYGEKAFWQRSVLPSFGGVNINIKMFVTTPATSGVMKFLVMTTSIGENDLWNQALGVIASVTMTAPGTAGSLGVTTATLTTPWTVDEVALIGISRMADDAEDTLDAEVELLWVEVKIA